MSNGEVSLARGLSAAEAFYNVLLSAIEAHPDVFQADLKLRSLAEFRKIYPSYLPRFELARALNGKRLEVARTLVTASNELLAFTSDSETLALASVLEGSATSLPLEQISYAGAPGWVPQVVYDGRRWQGSEIGDLATTLADRDVMTQAAARQLLSLCRDSLDNGQLDLSDRKIVMLGAGAEMAPTRLFLEAGAEVLWIDVVPPPESWTELAGMSGRLWFSPEGADLLRQPDRILATIKAFSDGSSVDLGLYAYAPGQLREIRLTQAMNAIVDALPRPLLRSVTTLISPTTPTLLSDEECEARKVRLDKAPFWQRSLAALRFFGRAGLAVGSSPCDVTQTVVGIQGLSYQAAQYLGKTLVAEVWAADGLRVSANTAAITRTRSMDHPVFAAAFEGAQAFGVETMTPRQSRALNGMLAVSDWLQPTQPKPGEVRLHGAVQALPYVLEEALRVAALIGFCRAPRLIGELLRR